MREYPILFSGAMVRAILEGRKTQTRRRWKMPRGLDWYISGCMRGAETGDIHDPASSWWGHVEEMACPYGRPGDRLWVRETWSPDFANHYPHDRVWYAADDDRRYDIEVRNGVRGIYSPESGVHVPFRWRPSIHMPRWACRLALEITDTRVERLQEITEADAIAEGIRPYRDGWERFHPDPADTEHTGATKDPRLAYKGLWEQLHGAGAWSANPWVWVVEFRRVTA